jgi:hypothetical protein
MQTQNVRVAQIEAVDSERESSTDRSCRLRGWNFASSVRLSLLKLHFRPSELLEI